MQEKNSVNTSIFGRILRFFAVVVLLLLAAAGGLYYFSSAQSKDRIPAAILDYAVQDLGIDLGFTSYRASNADDFPYVIFEIDGLYVKGTAEDDAAERLLNVERVRFKVSPWEVLTDKVQLRDIFIEGAKIRFFKDSTGLNNADFKEFFDASAGKPKKTRNSLFFNEVTARDVDFAFVDAQKGQRFAGKFSHLDLKNETQGTDVLLNAVADVHFEGLTFREKNGAFLEDKKAQLNLNFALQTDSIRMYDSALLTNGDTLQLSGNFSRGITSDFSLSVLSRGILLENARALLSDDLQMKLAPFAVKKPIAARFRVRKKATVGEKPRMRADFRTLDTDFKFNAVDVSDMSLVGVWISDCQTPPGEEVRRGEDCLRVRRVTGNLFDAHPVDLSGEIRNFKTLELSAKGTATMDLPALQPYLEKTIWELKAGKADVEIDYTGNFSEILKSKFRQRKGLTAQVKIRNARAEAYDIPLENINGNVGLTALRANTSDFTFSYKNTPLRLRGSMQNVLRYLFEADVVLQSDLELYAREVDVEKFTSETYNSSDKTLSLSLLDEQVAKISDAVTEIITGKAAVEIDRAFYRTTEAKNTNFTLEWRDTNSAKFSPQKPFFALKNFRTTVADSLQLQMNARAFSADNPRIEADIALQSPFSALPPAFLNEKIKFEKGATEINAAAEFLLADLENLNAENLELSGNLKIKNTAIYLPESEVRLSGLNSEISYTEDSISLQPLRGKVLGNRAVVTGTVANYLSYFDNGKKKTKSDLKIKIPRFSAKKLTGANTDEAFAAKTFFADLLPFFRKMRGTADIEIADFAVQDFPLKNLSFSLAAKKDNAGKINLEMSDISALLFDDAPLLADVKIIDLADPLLTVNLETKMAVEDFSRLLKNDNFRPEAGTTDLKITYANKLRDSLNVQHYLLDGDLNGRIEFSEGAVAYPPRGLTFDRMNGYVTYSRDAGLQVNFDDMLFNENTVSIDGRVQDFFPFFFEENEDFILEMNLRSPLIDFKKFRTPKAIAEELTEAEIAEATATENVIDRLLAEGKLSLNLQADKVVYVDFTGENVVGRADITDNDVRLDTFRMQTADGTMGLNAVINNIDKDFPLMILDLDFAEINAPKAFRGFQNFGQTTLTDENLKGTVDAEIAFSTVLNNNYEVQSETMHGTLDLHISDGEFIDFSGLNNLDGFLWKNRRLDHVYFSDLQVKIDVEGEDLHFAPFTFNSTAARFTMEGTYTFSDADRTDLYIEVPLGNIFTRYVNRETIRKNYKKRGGIPIIVHVTEKRKELEFGFGLYRKE